MKIVSFKAGPAATYGLVTNAGVIDAGKRLKDFPTLKTLLANGSLDTLKALQNERPDYAFAASTCVTTRNALSSAPCCQVGVSEACSPAKKIRPAGEIRWRY